MTSQVEMAFSLLSGSRILGVTGTVGKGTCCSLLSGMWLREVSPTAWPEISGCLPWMPSRTWNLKAWLLLELSSFQLSTLKWKSGHAVAVVLRHHERAFGLARVKSEYWDHKANLTRHQKPGDLCVYFEDAEGSAWIGAQGRGRKISIGQTGAIRVTK